jgi:hypothetical protein
MLSFLRNFCKPILGNVNKANLTVLRQDSDAEARSKTRYKVLGAVKNQEKQFRLYKEPSSRLSSEAQAK